MKKLLSLALVLVMVLTMSVTAFAADIKQDTENKTGTTEVTHTVSDSYIVTIPDSMTIGTDANVSVKDVVLASDQELTVSVSSAQYNDGWKLKNGDDTIGYTLKIDNTDVANNGTVLTVKSGETATKTLKTELSGTAKYSGNYTDMLTFSISTVTTVGNENDLKVALTSGGKIKLTDNITSSVNVSTSTPVVLDLNGKTLTATDRIGLVIESGSKVTINDETGSGGIKASEDVFDPKNIVCYGTLVINGGNYQDYSSYSLWFQDNADVTINGGIYRKVCGGTGSITINGGTIESFYCNSEVTVYITGGTVNVTPEGSIQGRTLITGGTFNFDPSATGSDNITVDTTTHTVTDNGDGTWTVTAK